MNMKMNFQLDNTHHHFDTDSTCSYQLQIMNDLIIFIEIINLPFGVVTCVVVVVVVLTGGTIVDTVPIYVSHRAPVYSAGQSQYAIFPFIRHIPPDKQYPAGQLAIIKHKKI